MSSASPFAKAPPAPGPAKHIDVLQSQGAQLYANIHPILLLSLLLASFRALVEDPVSTLLGLAPAVAVLQAVYCVVCLPYSGQAPVPTPKPGQKKKVQKPSQEVLARVVV